MEFTQNEIDKINEHNRNTANQISDDLGLSVKYLFLKDYPTATDERAFTWFFYFDEVEKKTTFTEHFGMKQKNYVMYHIEDRYKKRNDDF